METAWMIYWYLTVGKFVVFASVIATVVFIFYCAVVFIAGAVTGFGENAGEHGLSTTEQKLYLSLIPHCKKITAFFVFAMALVILYPGKKDVALIFGGAALVSVAQTDEAKKLPDNVIKAANTFLEGISEEAEE